jgi:hypothetical protein
MENRKKSVYLETTIPSYITARKSRDVIKAARQSMTKLFWEQERHKYELVSSQYVIDECSLGDTEASQKRLEFLSGILILEKSEKIDGLAAIYQNLLGIPDRSKTDCFHLAICVIARIHFLLSWNCAHLGINTYLKVRDYNEEQGLWTPLLITPENLLNFEDEEKEA